MRASLYTETISRNDTSTPSAPAPPEGIREDHLRTLLVGSGIDPQVVAERGYWTATRRDQLEGMPRYQRRAPSLVMPMHSPDGRTVSLQTRPDNPRERNGKVVKYETPGGREVVLDVHPRNADKVGDAAEDLWITEGVKKADALTSRGLCTVGLAGVWNWKTKTTDFHPDWEHIALSSRSVFIVFDSDVMVKANVEDALERLVGQLEARGANVKVVYLPDTEGGDKNGVDDYLVAGGTVEKLYGISQAFERRTFTEARMSRDGKLRAAVEEAWAAHEAMPTTKDSECTRRAVWRSLVKTGAERGKVVGGELRFYLSSDQGAIRASVSQPTFIKHMLAMEAEGRVEVERPEDPSKANVYTLKNWPFGNDSSKPPAQRKAHEGEEEFTGEDSPRALYDRRDSQTATAQEGIPEARWSRVIRSWRVDELGLRICDVEPLLRLGPRRREILVHLAGYGGEAPVDDLLARFASPSTTRSKFVSRILGPMVSDFPIVAVENGVIYLRDDWQGAFVKAREVGEEDAAAVNQATDYEIRRLAFHSRDKVKPDRAPTRKEMDEKRKPMSREAPEQADFAPTAGNGAARMAHMASGESSECYGTSEFDGDGSLIDLSADDERAYVSIVNYEMRFGLGSYNFDRASAKNLFYQIELSVWPDQDQHDRIQPHYELEFGTAPTLAAA